jgi:hypothetical protein
LRIWKHWPSRVLRITLGDSVELNQSLQP